MSSDAPTGTQPASKRWTYFHSALQLAIQRAAHKWTYEDFTECFSQWCEEQPESASVVFNKVSQHMESSITDNCDMLFEQFNVRDNLDRLHAVVTEARARKQTGYDGKDVWREDLQPDASVWARTVPVFEAERDRLRAELQELDHQNLALQGQFQDNVRTREHLDDEAAALLDVLDQIQAKWDKLPLEEIQEWTLQTAESVNSVRPTAG